MDGGLTCWDAKAAGKKVWGLNLYDDYKVGRRPKLTRIFHRDYGYTASPLVHKDWLIVEVGSTARGSVSGARQAKRSATTASMPSAV